jgi:hypothetical protein
MQQNVSDTKPAKTTTQANRNTDIYKGKSEVVPMHDMKPYGTAEV